MEKVTVEEKQTGLTRTWLLVVVGFSGAAFLVRWADLTIPVMGTARMDPREIFVTLGAAFTGPVGGLVIGFLSGLPALFVVSGFSSILAHSLSGLFIGFLYKAVYQHWRMPVLLLGWIVLVAVYYYIFLIPAFLTVILLIQAGGLSGVLGVDLSFFQAYRLLASLAFPEVAMTLVVTAIVLLALPEKYRQPLW